MSPRIPVGWRLAGMLRRMPEFRGRDRLEGLVLKRAHPPEGIHTGTFGPRLRFRVSYSDDTKLEQLYLLQFERPSLVPILEAALQPGDTFFDIGANVGVYAGWGARLVGNEGAVHAFEPVPSTMAFFAEFLSLNELRQVHAVPLAVGASKGTLPITTFPNRSGISSAVPSGAALGVASAPTAHQITVEMTSVDRYVSESNASIPRLIKIDVEGYEYEVIRGARGTLSQGNGPILIFESEATSMRSASTSLDEIVSWLRDQVGYETFALTPRGLRPVSRTDERHESLNCLALHPSRHAEIGDRLARQRFRRNQTC